MTVASRVMAGVREGTSCYDEKSHQQRSHASNIIDRRPDVAITTNLLIRTSATSFPLAGSCPLSLDHIYYRFHF